MSCDLCYTYEATCTLYDSSGTTWPRSCFPAYMFRRVFSSQGLMRSASDAWAYFETVESTDAATRVRLSGTGWDSATNPSPWIPLVSESNMTRYNRGQNLHVQVCPSYNWTSQRTYGISSDPVINVYPPLCNGSIVNPIHPFFSPSVASSTPTKTTPTQSATNSPKITSTKANPPLLSMLSK